MNNEIVAVTITIPAETILQLVAESHKSQAFFFKCYPEIGRLVTGLGLSLLEDDELEQMGVEAARMAREAERVH